MRNAQYCFNAVTELACLKKAYIEFCVCLSVIELPALIALVLGPYFMDALT